MQATVKQIEKILECLHKNGFQAIIAGGWARDVYLYKDPKDIDIFVLNAKEEEDVGRALYALKGKSDYINLLDFSYCDNVGSEGVKNFLNKEFSIGEYNTLYTEYGNTNMREDVLALAKFKDFNIDIIFTKGNLIETLNNFDTSICQIFSTFGTGVGDNELELYATKDFLDFVTKGVIYRYEDIPTTDNHLQRISQKFGVDVEDFLLVKSDSSFNLQYLGKVEERLCYTGVTL